MTKLETLDRLIINGAKKSYIPVARTAFFVVFFYFGIIKILGFSPASPLAEALTIRTVGLEYFDVLFFVLAVVECAIGLLFLFPKATRAVILLLAVHMLIVCSPLVLAPDHVWVGFLVPNLEGQYIIKNIALVAVAIGIAASVAPLKKHGT